MPVLESRPMRAFTRRNLEGWGRYPRENCDVYRPEFIDDVPAILERGQHETILARGNGRSYGDQALNPSGGVIETVRLDRFLAFDPLTGLLTCEAGVSLADINRVFLVRGWSLPVSPGTQFVTVGGAIANDVHGKNHHHIGSFGDHVRCLTLWTPAFGVLTCSPDAHSEIFWATVGGMGLTGVILTATLQLESISSTYVEVDYERSANLEDTLTRFEASDAAYQYSVAWIDVLARGPAAGRSVLMRGNVADVGGLDLPSTRPLKVPFDAPPQLLTPWSVRAFNAAYYYKHPVRVRKRIQRLAYLYPLDSIVDWNRMYGRRGFLQYQATVPQDGGAEALSQILKRLGNSGLPAFLAVLKRFGPAGKGLMSHPMAGYTLALDLPWRPGLTEFLHGCDEILLAYGGRVYLAKDAVTTPKAVEAMYPDLTRFRAVLSQVDPERRLNSSQARRLQLHGS